MKNKKEKYNIYNAFDSINTPDERTKERIFKNVIREEQKKVFRFRNIAVPAAAALLICVNAGLIYTSLNSGSSEPESSNDEFAASVSESGISTAKTSGDIIKTSETYQTIVVSGAENTISDTILSTALQSAIETSSTTAVNETAAVQTSEAYAAESSVPVQTESPAETPEQTQKPQGELLPPVSSELQNLFSAAYNVYFQYSMGNAMFLDYNESNDYNAEENDIELDGKFYSRTSQKYFTDLQSVKAYFEQYFTDDFIETLDIMSHFTEYNGRVYCETWGKGGILGYAGHTYDITSQSDSEIDIAVHCYVINDLNNAPDMDNYIYSVPDNLSDYDVIERSIIFRKENGQWRVAHVDLMW